MASLTVRDIIKTAQRQIGAIASGDDPTASEMADGLIALNRLRRGMAGTQIGTRLGPIMVAATTVQAENGGEYEINAGAACTLTPPNNPKAGCRFGVVDSSLSFATNPLTILHNGVLINGVAADYVMNTNGGSARFWFRGDTGNWVIEQDFTVLDATTDLPDVVADYLPSLLAVMIASEYGADVPDNVAQQAQEGREVLARTYARRGRLQIDAPIGVVGNRPQPQQRGG